MELKEVNKIMENPIIDEEEYIEDDYKDDYDENPIIEEDIRETLLEFGFGEGQENELNFYVDRHYWSDGKHKVTLENEKFGEIELDVNAYTKKEDFKEMLKEILTELREYQKVFKETNISNTMIKIAVLTEDGDLIVHKVSKEEIEKESFNESDGFEECLDLWLSDKYDLDCIQYQIIHSIEIDELYEVYHTDYGMWGEEERGETRRFIELSEAKEYFEKSVEELKEEIRNSEDKFAYDESSQIIFRDIIKGEILEAKPLDQIIEELEE